MKREDFNKWATGNNWVLIREDMNPNGRNLTFLTPAGNITIIMFDLKGDLACVAQPVPTPNQMSPIQPISSSCFL